MDVLKILTATLKAAGKGDSVLRFSYVTAIPGVIRDQAKVLIQAIDLLEKRQAKWWGEASQALLYVEHADRRDLEAKFKRIATMPLSNRGVKIMCKFRKAHSCLLVFVMMLLIVSAALPAKASIRAQVMDNASSPSPPVRQRAIRVDIFDGSRSVLADGSMVYVRLTDGKGKQVFAGNVIGPSIRFMQLPFYDNFQDNYSINVSVKGFGSAGLTGIKAKKSGETQVSLMLLPRQDAYDFADAQWQRLEKSRPEFIALFRAGASSQAAAQERYEGKVSQSPDSVACLLNIVTALSQLRLDQSDQPLSFLRELTWDETMAQDRFYAYSSKDLVAAVEKGEKQGMFEKVPFPSLEHKGATRSWREKTFSQANLQITFHERSVKLIDGQECVRVELDIDYYRDGLSHLLGEVIPNIVTTSRTDPRKVFRMRWTAAANSGKIFVPPYSIVGDSTNRAFAARENSAPTKSRVKSKNRILPPWKWKIRRSE